MTVLALLPLLFIPGYLTLAAWPGARRLDFWERLFLASFAGILLVSWIALVLAETGLFSVPSLATVLLAYSAGVALLARRRLQIGWLGLPSGDWTAILLIAIMVVAGWAFSRPAEVVAGTFDPGIYLSTAATISQHGSIAYTDPFLSQVDAALRPFLIEQRTETGVGAVRLPAFWMPEADQSTVIPAFFHLYPVWLAVFYALGGLQAALYVSPLFGMMGVWALFLLGRRLGGPGVGLLAAALLAVNPAQVWFARYPISEATVQMLLLGGLTLLVLMQHERSRFLAVMAGAALGLTHLAKVDQVFVPVAIGVMLFGAWLFNRSDKDAPQGAGDGDVSLTRLYMAVAIPYVLLVVHAALHMYLFSFAYTWINFSPFIPALRSGPAVLGYIIVYLAVATAVIFRARVVLAWHCVAAHSSRLTGGFALLVGAASVYGYFFWPLGSDPNASTFLSSDGVTPVYLNMFREQGVVRLGWYLTPLGLALGLAGFVKFAGKTARAGALPVLIVFTLQTVLHVLSAGLAYPVQYWAMRRYVPVVIPVFLLFAAFAVIELYRHGRKGGEAGAERQPESRSGTEELTAEPPARLYSEGLRRLVAGGLAAVLLVSSALTSNSFLWQTEYRGALEGLGRWASRMQDPAIVLFKPRMEGNIFSAPLQNFFGKTAFVLQKEMEEPFYSAGVQRWLSEGKGVYLALSDRYPRHISGQLEYQLVDDEGLFFNNMEQSTDRVPQSQVQISFPVRLYHLLPARGYPYNLQAGALEMDETLSLHLDQTAARALDLTFRAGTTGTAQSPLAISINGAERATVTVSPGLSEYRVRLPLGPSAASGPVELTLAVPKPVSSGSGGIMLEWVQVAEANTD